MLKIFNFVFNFYYTISAFSQSIMYVLFILGKSRSLIGDDSSCADFGIIPAAISWLYHLIEEQKNKTGARFSIRISALEIRGKDERLTDLLAHSTSGKYLRGRFE